MLTVSLIPSADEVAKLTQRLRIVRKQAEAEEAAAEEQDGASEEHDDELMMMVL